MVGETIKVNKEDLLDVLALQKEAFYKVAQAENNFSIMPMTQSYEDIVSEFEKKTFLKYVLDEKIVGSVRAFLDDDKICYIGRLIVKPSFQRQGIGSKLISEIEEVFSSANKYSIFTSENSKSTIRLYNKLGYREVGKVEEDNTCMIIMEKERLA